VDDATSWPEAAIAIAGILFITTVIVAGAWQIFATWRTRMIVAREDAYRKLAEDATSAQRQTAERLETAAQELAQLRQQTAELERVLKEVG
jgi:F0F1-type ATP synthase membrane subunit b/b'